jgi:tRNA threonylcarbamoyladenosine biosynthesis protein TsaE
MADYSFTCTDAASTAALGASLAGLLRTSDILLFYGDLGAGKTTLIRGLIQAMAAGENVVSPTFTLVQTYPTQKGTIYHYDLYRLGDKDTAALEELGWEDGLVTGISLVEWPERLENRPEDALIVRIEILGPELRRVHLVTNASWEDRLKDIKDRAA